MADTMDVDMDIDLTVDPEIAALEAEALKIQARAEEAAQAPETLNNSLVVEDDKAQPVPNKVNVRGLDHFTTQDIRQFASENYSTEELQQRIEWIDDSSANIVYNTEQAALEALKAFSDPAESIPEQISPLQSRKAKSLSTHVDTELYVRIATTGDVKAPRAHERSRFYLMNPEHDPRERRRDYDDRRGRGGRGRRAGPDRRRREEPQQKFDVSMYDDDNDNDNDNAGEDLFAPERRRSHRQSPAPRDQGRRQRHTEGDLFAHVSQGRLRDRSASPVRDGDGRFGFDEDQPRRSTARRRSFSPPARRRQINSQSSNAVQELFPNKQKSSALDDTVATNFAAAAVTSPPKRNRELFPNKTPRSNHRRSDALDSEETQHVRRNLADRITGAPPHVVRATKPVAAAAAPSNGFSIRGNANDQAPGFSIRGASRELNPVVKELFPSKLESGGNGSEDLFADKLRTMNAQRRRAEDLF